MVDGHIFLNVRGLLFDHSKEVTGAFRGIIIGGIILQFFCHLLGVSLQVGRGFESVLPRRLTLHEQRLAKVVIVILYSRTKL